MRHVVLSLGISIDGYIARRDGAVDFLFMPKDFSMAPFLSTIDTIVMGRKTLDAARAMGGAGSFGAKMSTYVFSRTAPPGKRGGVEFVDQPAAAFVERLRQQPGKDIWLMGGGELAREFLQADAVDRLHLGVVPVLLGDGIPLFQRGFPQRDFTLVENRTFSQGLIALEYARTRKEARTKAATRGAQQPATQLSRRDTALTSR